MLYKVQEAIFDFIANIMQLLRFSFLFLFQIDKDWLRTIGDVQVRRG